MPRVIEVYRKTAYLEDDKVLEIKVVVNKQRGGSYDPADVDTEVSYRLDGVEVDREEVLAEVTAEELDQLVDAADRCEEDGD